jgi:uncharacterized protein YdbL (DUF1318 family)
MSLARREPPLGILALVAVAFAACVPVTVNINFPQEQLDSAAGQIVDMGRKPEGTPPAPTTPKPGSSLDRWLAPLAPREAVAQQPPETPAPQIRVAQAPKTDSEELRRLAESQNRRLATLQRWLARGCIGENNQGFLEPRPGEGCSGEVARVMAEENRDRQAIVDTFMRQNRIPASDVGRVKASFAKAYRDRAGGGQWIQTDKGDWVKK